jgi:hypothetical protein
VSIEAIRQKALKNLISDLGSLDAVKSIDSDNLRLLRKWTDETIQDWGDSFLGGTSCALNPKLFEQCYNVIEAMKKFRALIPR